jgi:hypothetical protein
VHSAVAGCSADAAGENISRACVLCSLPATDIVRSSRVPAKGDRGLLWSSFRVHRAMFSALPLPGARCCDRCASGSWLVGSLCLLPRRAELRGLAASGAAREPLLMTGKLAMGESNKRSRGSVLGDLSASEIAERAHEQGKEAIVSI